MTIVIPQQIESLDAFQNRDDSDDWRSHNPQFAWTEEDLEEFEHEKRVAEQERQAMIGWWEMEGVRCGTFGRDPQQNPYL